MRAAVVLVLATALAACEPVGPNYRVPEQALVNAPFANGRFATSDAAVSDGALPPQWWRLYDNSDIDRLIAQAFAANTDLRVAEANLERSRALVKEAQSG